MDLFWFKIIKKNRTNERTLKMLNHCHLNWIQGTRLKKEDTFSYVQFFFSGHGLLSVMSISYRLQIWME